jgi:uncharacterized protein (TIGR03086 family)
MDDIDLLNEVLGNTADLVEGVRPDDWNRPTPCSEYDVRGLVAHMVGWSSSFDAAANGHTPKGDPALYQVTDRTAAEFRLAVTSIVGGWQDHGTDREVSLVGPGGMPGAMVLDMTLMEYLAHGWDLATATSQPMPYSEDAAQEVLVRAEHGPLANEQYRGSDQPFGPIVDVALSAPAIERFAGFMGRTP